MSEENQESPGTEEPAVESTPEPSIEAADPAQESMETSQEMDSDEPETEAESTKGPARSLNTLLDVPLEVRVVLGTTRMEVSDVLQLGQGSVIELDKIAGEPLDILVNGKLLGKGDSVKVNDVLGVRIAEIVTAESRLSGLQK
ncbi:MAG: flagellar motor switch protein FliN [Bdellovibrionales bacterium]|nr:flagellar motor switch protein FliN [Bdellovibrionales bacterium]